MKPEEVQTELRPSEKPLIVAGPVQVPNGESIHPKLPNVLEIIRNQ